MYQHSPPTVRHGAHTGISAKVISVSALDMTKVSGHDNGTIAHGTGTKKVPGAAA